MSWLYNSGDNSAIMLAVHEPKLRYSLYRHQRAGYEMFQTFQNGCIENGLVGFKFTTTHIRYTKFVCVHYTFIIFCTFFYSCMENGRVGFKFTTTQIHNTKFVCVNLHLSISVLSLISLLRCANTKFKKADSNRWIDYLLLSAF